MEQKSIFRKASIDRMKSPEQLNDCLRLASPGIWILLSAVLLILAGVFVWALTGSMTNKLDTVVVSQEERSCVFVSENDIDLITEAAKVRVDGKEHTVREAEGHPVKAEEVLSEYAMHLAQMSGEDWVYVLTLAEQLPEGEYKAELITDTVTPISYLFN